MQPRQSYRGRPRQRKTRWTVRLADTVAQYSITFSGLGTILAVGTVFVFLVWVVIPLFRPASVDNREDISASWLSRPAQFAVDEDQLLGWSLGKQGKVHLFDLGNGKLLQEPVKLFGTEFTAASPILLQDVEEAGQKINFKEMAFGFKDGSVRKVKFSFRLHYPVDEEVPVSLRDLKGGETWPIKAQPERGASLACLLGASQGRGPFLATAAIVAGKPQFQTGILTRTVQDQLRFHYLEVEVSPKIESPTRSPIVLIDHTVRQVGPITMPTFCVLQEGSIRLNTVREIENLLTGEITRELDGVEIPYNPPAGQALPDSLLLSADAEEVYLVWKDGSFNRFNTRELNNITQEESGNLLQGADAELTSLRYLLGKSTILVGDSRGTVRAWFKVNSPTASTSDQTKLVCGHVFPGTGAAVTTLTTSTRSRMMGVGYADGSVRVYSVTSENRVADLTTVANDPVHAVALAPKDDGLLAVNGPHIFRWSFDPGHHEVSLKSLFGKVWYEGAEKPAHVWQSSSGSDAFEPKFGVVPLIVGTLKGSFYCLLFAVPVALLAAVYTSEFMRPSTRAVVKPTIEMMASLPSVVLGFLAGLVFAQFVEKVVPAVLASFLTVPLSFLLGAYLWQMIPEKVGLRLARWRFLLCFLALPFGLFAGYLLGPVMERWLFAGNLRAWLDGSVGSTVGGWMLLFLPISAMIVILTMSTLVNPRLRRLASRWNRGPVAALDLGKFVLAIVASFSLAVLLSWIMDKISLDPRGFYLGTYNQRNALVVGFAMGFAVIPIIYTIAEDALSSVPEHLRSGSLATGATQWQTAVRIVIPTAMSGLFSAVMIGLGRAVGETMIVVMAAGNTPITDWSIFSGFRTLSANIAVKLPEAVRSRTHFRTLFLAAFLLFAMTFVLNTVAEIIRLRFRRRAYQL